MISQFYNQVDEQYYFDDINYMEDQSQIPYFQQGTSEIHAHYKQAKRGDIIKKIWQDIKIIQSKTQMSQNWCFMLYQRCEWKMSNIDELLIDKSNYKDLINYTPKFQITTKSKKMCQVCLTYPVALKNSCGHIFCFQCWKQNISSTLKNEGKVIPKCPEPECRHKMNYQMIKKILTEQKTKKLTQNFQKILGIKYSKSNPDVRVCPSMNCQTEFIIDIPCRKPISCSCKSYACTFCGKFYHHPLQCYQIKNWQKIVKLKEKEWIKILFFKCCPKCDNPIEKNEGCNHMTCKCKYQFCWKCLKNWQSHKICQGILTHDKSEQQFKKALKDQQNSQQKYQTVNDEVQRLHAIQKRIEGYNINLYRHQIGQICQINASSLLFLVQIQRLAGYCLQFCRDCAIYQFFTPSKQYIPIYEVQMKTAYFMFNEIDDYIEKVYKHIQFIINSHSQIYQLQEKKQSTAKLQQLIDKNKTGLIESMKNDKIMQIKNKISKLNQYMQKIIEDSCQ